MPAAYLHGVEVLPLNNGPVQIQAVKSSVIGLVGIAPKGATTPTLISNAKQAAETFGSELPDFSIPKALSAIFAQGSGLVVVVNVFDEATHTATNTDVALTATASGKTKTATAPVGSTFTLKNNAGTTTYVKGTDYTVDDFGNITILNLTTIPNGTVLKATWKNLVIANVTAAHIIGTSTGTNKTGFKALQDSAALLGVQPRVLLTPYHSTLTGVAAEMIAQADLLKGVALLDLPSGNTPTQAVTARGSSGTVAGYNSGSKRLMCLYPHVKAFDAYSNASENRPSSMYWAGVISATDKDFGYHVSPSNKEIKGIVGLERTVSWSLTDDTAEANTLNSNGICTIVNGLGTGFRTWGNRNAAFPATSTPDVFIPVQRTRDLIEDSVAAAMLPFIDRPIEKALIDAIKESVNNFLRSLKARGAIVDGNCLFVAANNPTSQISAGQLVFDIEFMPPTPAERLTFQTFINVNLLNAVLS